MTGLALLVLSRAERRVGNPFILVTETESTDNFANNGNSMGGLNGARPPAPAVEVARRRRRR